MASKKVEMYAKKRYELDEIKNKMPFVKSKCTKKQKYFL